MKYTDYRKHALRLLEEYAKHFSLNIGQALQGIRYVYSHPDVDEVAPRGTLRHVALSAELRSKRIVNDLFFAALPPHWHHTRQELDALTTVTASKWFQYGYCAWRFDLLGKAKPDLSGVDKRWDPRCTAYRG